MYECSWPPVYWPCFFVTNLVAPSQTECACEKQPSRDLLTQVATQTGETGETGKAESFKVLPSGVGEGETHCVFPHLGSLFSKMTAGDNCRNFQLTHPPPPPLPVHPLHTRLSLTPTLGDCWAWNTACTGVCGVCHQSKPLRTCALSPGSPGLFLSLNTCFRETATHGLTLRRSFSTDQRVDGPEQRMAQQVRRTISSAMRGLGLAEDRLNMGELWGKAMTRCGVGFPARPRGVRGKAGSLWS